MRFERSSCDRQHAVVATCEVLSLNDRSAAYEIILDLSNAFYGCLLMTTILEF